MGPMKILSCAMILLRHSDLGAGFYMQGECSNFLIHAFDINEKTKRFGEREEMTAREAGHSSLEDSIHIGLLSHKYQCNEIEQWALKLIHTKLASLCAKPPGRR